MKTLIITISLSLAPACAAEAQPAAAEAAPAINAGYLTSAEKARALREGATVEVREQTTISPTAGLPGETEIKAAAANDALRDLEENKGAEPGTLKFEPRERGGLLTFDAAKAARAALGHDGGAFSAGAGSNSGAKSVAVPATLEFKTEATPIGSQQVVAVDAGGTLFAGRASRSGREPLSLEVLSADLTARQVPGAEEELPVEVKVGSITRTLSVGDIATLGEFEVEIESSTNHSGLPLSQQEGAPYGLSLRIRPAPRSN